MSASDTGETRVEVTLHPDARIKGDKAKIVNAVVDIYTKHGMLTPDILIKAARSKSSPLHSEFTWDANQALQEVQRSQALYLIRVISLEITEVNTDDTYRGREFVLNPVSGSGEYISIRTALSDTEMRQQMIEQLLDRLDNLKRELKAFEEFSEVVEAITSVAKSKRKSKTAQAEARA